VLRLVPGDEVIVVHEGAAEVVRLTRVDGDILGTHVADVDAPRLPPVAIAQGLAKGEKMDDVVRQCTELGVARIIPFMAERSVVKLDPMKAAARTGRWRRIAAEAAKQSQRVDIPVVHDLVRTVDLPGLLAPSAVLLCQEDAPEAPGIGAALRAMQLHDEAEVALIVGPEGGLTFDEVSMLRHEGAVVVSLGPTILRTETAGVVATALAVYLRGGLGAGDE
jgi:16S rRNA (uracil1498-N3)-methyltransferase